MGIHAFHLLGESRLDAPAAMYENPVVTSGQQPHDLARRSFGIGLALLGRKGGESDPDALFGTERIGPHGGRRRPGIGEFESELPEDVAIAQYLSLIHI